MKRINFKQRAEKFLPRYAIQSSSYEIVEADDSTAWMAKTLILDDTYDSITYREMYPTPNTHYSTKEQADAVALWVGLEWLEDGLPSLPPVVPSGMAAKYAR